jgi:hypothetical protein
VRTNPVVILSPLLQLFACIGEREKQLHVQTLIAQAIENVSLFTIEHTFAALDTLCCEQLNMSAS